MQMFSQDSTEIEFYFFVSVQNQNSQSIPLKTESPELSEIVWLWHLQIYWIILTMRHLTQLLHGRVSLLDVLINDPITVSCVEPEI